jgi:hypothetical protein
MAPSEDEKRYMIEYLQEITGNSEEEVSPNFLPRFL